MVSLFPPPSTQLSGYILDQLHGFHISHDVEVEVSLSATAEQYRRRRRRSHHRQRCIHTTHTSLMASRGVLRRTECSIYHASDDDDSISTEEGWNLIRFFLAEMNLIRIQSGLFRHQGTSHPAGQRDDTRRYELSFGKLQILLEKELDIIYLAASP
ncbi:hypothetical protein CF319_g8718 [Tilletia indica]|nr:hypothetical protein CF319_g8718 [Tilletia indica]